MTSNRKVTDLVQGCSDPKQVLCLFTREVLSEKRKLVQRTTPIKQHPQTTELNYTSHPCLPFHPYLSLFTLGTTSSQRQEVQLGRVDISVETRNV